MVISGSSSKETDETPGKLCCEFITIGFTIEINHIHGKPQAGQLRRMITLDRKRHDYRKEGH
jgi:hypothetical protein